MNPDSTKSSDDPSYADLKGEPTWLLRFLAQFACDSIPKILFARVADISARWNNDGELDHGSFNCLHLVHPDFEQFVEKCVRWRLWSESFIKSEDRERFLDSLDDLATAGELKISTKKSQLIILTIVASAFPESWCEVIWEDVEEELWEIVESTCLPLLGVLDTDDLKLFLEEYMSARKVEFLFILLKFLIRISVLLASKTPPNLFQLISQSIDLFRDYVNLGQDSFQEDLDYLLLLRSIAEILIDKHLLSTAAERLHNLSPGGSMRANSAIGFALGAIPPSHIAAAPKESLRWTPLLPDMPSTMEILVQSQLFGAVSLRELSGVRWDDLRLSTRVLVGFAEARKKAFFEAVEVLEPLISDVQIAYGRESLELLLVGTTLVNCYNATQREVDGEMVGNYVSSNVFWSLMPRSCIGPLQETYLMVAISDSFLGQGKYVEARRLLIQVLNHSSTKNIHMSATLRLLKMSRRERDPSSLLEGWTRLGHALWFFDKVSDVLKYECIEETVCLLSVLEPEQIAKIPQAAEIVKTLTNYNISAYEGPSTSRLNLHQNIEELKRFKSKLNLFSISGPQLAYCRKLRERFIPASVQIIEKVGSQNWQRFKRIEQMREIEVLVEVGPQTLLPAKSVFQDSGLGSSLGSDPPAIDTSPPSPPKVARSVTTIRSSMPYQEGATLLPPMPPLHSNGLRICSICKTTILGVTNESQWRRHAFSDLRPYVCIVDGCDVDHMNFASRAEFAAHLTQHQHSMVWTCSKCGHAEENQDLIRDHVYSKHVTDNKEDRNNYIVQKRILRDLSSQSCPFCNQIPGIAKFVGHLCNHLEEISLSAIPRHEEEDEEGDEDEKGSPSSRSSLSTRMMEDILEASESAEEVIRNIDSDHNSLSPGAAPIPITEVAEPMEGVHDDFDNESLELDIEKELEEALARENSDHSDSEEESEEEVTNKPEVLKLMSHEYPPEVPQDGGDGLVQEDTLDKQKRDDDDDDLEKELEEALNAAADDSDSGAEQSHDEQTRDLRPKRRLITRHEQDRLRMLNQKTLLDDLAKFFHVDDDARGEEAPQKPYVRPRRTPRRTTKKLSLSDYKSSRLKKDTLNTKPSENSPTLSSMRSFNSKFPSPPIIPDIQGNAVIEPPTAGSIKGDEYLPRLQPSAYKLEWLRKRMKTDDNWPSNTMMARKMEQLGRSSEDYRTAVAKADAEGSDAAERIDSIDEVPPPTARSLKRPRAQPATSKATDTDSDDEPKFYFRSRKASNVQSQLPNFDSFESQDIYDSKAQLPYPGDYTSSANTSGIGLIGRNGPINPIFYAPTRADKSKQICKRCNKESESFDSVDCAICLDMYHMDCVSPPLMKKPSCGYAWTCSRCSQKDPIKNPIKSRIRNL